MDGVVGIFAVDLEPELAVVIVAVARGAGVGFFGDRVDADRGEGAVVLVAGDAGSFRDEFAILEEGEVWGLRAAAEGDVDDITGFGGFFGEVRHVVESFTFAVGPFSIAEAELVGGVVVDDAGDFEAFGELEALDCGGSGGAEVAVNFDGGAVVVECALDVAHQGAVEIPERWVVGGGFGRGRSGEAQSEP